MNWIGKSEGGVEEVEVEMEVEAEVEVEGVGGAALSRMKE
jgi:hypothetical protein